MRVSVVIPTLNEADTIEHTLIQVRQAGECEIIVVDGGSDDGTLDAAILFLHADTVPPARFSQLIDHALTDPAVVGGRFNVYVDAPGWPFRMIGTLMNIRSRLTGIATGDQGIFVRRETFASIGGYPEWEIMEDLELSRQLKRAGKIACLRDRVRTSARRWQKHGVTKTILIMWGLRLCHSFGVRPASLKAFYADTR